MIAAAEDLAAARDRPTATVSLPHLAKTPLPHRRSDHDDPSTALESARGLTKRRRKCRRTISAVDGLAGGEADEGEQQRET
jgi:hypothetical protein